MPNSVSHTFDRRALANQAMKASIATRSKGQLNQISPICVYSLCETLGVRVRFNDINMEGMYEKGPPSRIHLSSKRPLVRKTFSCGHELGHHVFKHGFSIDELKDRATENSWDDPKEFLADTFSGFLLMPVLGIRQAFAVRGWNPATASPIQLYAIASDFGVGYSTLLTHLSVGLNLISHSRTAVLRKATPKSIRAEILGELHPDHLIISDRYRLSPSTDAEVGTRLLLPLDSESASDALIWERDLSSGRLFRAAQPGIAQVTAANGLWATFVRIAKKEYVGLAEYRHLEVDADD
jgi:Zn-dependent peptidase ImmA (M78 family)